MIVKCEQCQTRFKIPDDKVTDKGVKVRCTKCGHTFRVTRDMAQPAAAPAAAAAPPPLANDPFAKFGAPAAPPMGEVTRPGVFALGVEATRAPERAPPAGSFDFASLAPPATTAPTMPAVQAYAPSLPTMPAVPAYAPTTPAIPAYVPPAAAASNPFDFASVSPPAPAAPAPAAFDFSGFAAPTQPIAPLPVSRPPPGPPPPASAPPPAFDFSKVAPPAPAAPPAPSYGFGAGAPATAAPAAFDFASVAPPAAAAPAAFDFASVAPPAPAAPAAFDFAAVAPPTPAAPQQAPAFDFAAVAPPTPAPSASSSPFDFGGAPAGGADNFFASTPAPAEFGGPSAGDARAMFDLPPPPAAAPAPSLLDLPPVEPEAAPAAKPVERAPAPAAPAAKPSAEAPEPGRRRNAVGIVVNVVIAAALVVGLVVVGSVYLNEGKLSADALSLENLKNTFAPSVDFVANDVSNGLYETRQGRAVFFVRGEVLNRSEASVKVVVKAEIVEGGKVVRFGESFAGDPATPEELYLIDGAEALEALNRKVEKRALVVPPGAAAAFVVPFTEYPPDLKDFRVRVSARAVQAEPTAATP